MSPSNAREIFHHSPHTGRAAISVDTRVNKGRGESARRDHIKDLDTDIYVKAPIKPDGDPVPLVCGLLVTIERLEEEYVEKGQEGLVRVVRVPSKLHLNPYNDLVIKRLHRQDAKQTIVAFLNEVTSRTITPMGTWFAMTVGIPRPDLSEEPILTQIGWDSVSALEHLAKVRQRVNDERHPIKWPLLKVENVMRQRFGRPQRWPDGILPVPPPELMDDPWRQSRDMVEKAYDMTLASLAEKLWHDMGPGNPWASETFNELGIQFDNTNPPTRIGSPGTQVVLDKLGVFGNTIHRLYDA